MGTPLAWSTAPFLLHAVTPFVSCTSWTNFWKALRFHPESGFVRSTAVTISLWSIVVMLKTGPFRLARSYEM